jgi:hypothetical protein
MGILNDNAGAIQGISTVALVLITYWYARLTRQIATSSREAQRPYVYLQLAADSGSGFYLVYLVIGNSGDRAAHDFAATIEPTGDADLDAKLAAISALAHGIPYIAPGQRYYYSFEVDRRIYDETNSPIQIGIDARYQEGRRSYRHSVPLSFGPMRGASFRSFSDPLDSVAYSIDRMAQDLRPRPKMSRNLGRRSCPACFEMIYRNARKCPHCLEWTNFDHATDQAGSQILQNEKKDLVSGSSGASQLEEDNLTAMNGSGQSHEEPQSAG